MAGRALREKAERRLSVLLSAYRQRGTPEVEALRGCLYVLRGRGADEEPLGREVCRLAERRLRYARRERRRGQS